jgi:hypothetical protein
VASEILALAFASNMTLMNVTSTKIGINYRGTAKALNGCVNDAKNVREFLMSMFDGPIHTAIPVTQPLHRELEFWEKGHLGLDGRC